MDVTHGRLPRQSVYRDFHEPDFRDARRDENGANDIQE